MINYVAINCRGATYQAVGLQTVVPYASDPKASARDLLKSNNCGEAHPKHVFECIEDSVDFVRRTLLKGDPIGAEDLMTAGFPCEPYARVRSGRFDAGSWQGHKDTKALMELITYIKVRRPKLIVLENVRGFGQAVAGETDEDIPLKYLERRLDEVTDKSMAHQSVIQNHKIWAECDRERLSL